jgi:hypothetical protein
MRNLRTYLDHHIGDKQAAHHNYEGTTTAAAMHSVCGREKRWVHAFWAEVSLAPIVLGGVDGARVPKVRVLKSASAMSARLVGAFLCLAISSTDEIGPRWPAV